MGCDIHFYVERYTEVPQTHGPQSTSVIRESKIDEIIESPRDPRWVSVDDWQKIKESGERTYWRHDSHFYHGRNYWLFYFLADVRGGPVNPLESPRGVPDDASDSYLYIVKEWDGDGHSHSFFTLSELLLVPEETWTTLQSNFIETLDKMKQVDPNPDNVRAVFFFDN